MTTTSTTRRDRAPQTDQISIRPFRVNVPEAELAALRERIRATRWPERETVADASQGVQLATIEQLARYWATDYDWRRCEAKLNALPHVTGATYCSAECAKKDLASRLHGDLEGSISELNSNPLPPSFDLTLDDPDNLEAVRAVVQLLKDAVREQEEDGTYSQEQFRLGYQL